MTPVTESQDLGDKYEDLSGKSAEETAEIVGRVEKSNFLAHSIREIELALLIKRRVHFHIVTVMSSRFRGSGVWFSESGCEIRIRYPDADLDHGAFPPFMGVRLVLAHELGHLTYNFDHIPNLMKMSNPLVVRQYPAAQEVYAWRFARRLIMVKGEEHKKSRRHPEFVYETEAINRFLMWRLRGKIPDAALGEILAH